MNIKDPRPTALRLNECTNRQDVEGVAELMTEDHTFSDREGTTVQTKGVKIRGWKEFFQMFPKYWNSFTRLQPRDDRVVILGTAYWSGEIRPVVGERFREKQYCLCRQVSHSERRAGRTCRRKGCFLCSFGFCHQKVRHYDTTALRRQKMMTDPGNPGFRGGSAETLHKSAYLSILHFLGTNPPVRAVSHAGSIYV